MKKLLSLLLFIALILCCVACEKKPAEPAKDPVEEPSLTIRYHDGKTSLGSETYTSEEFSLREYRPSGKVFLGWYTDAELQNAYDPSKAAEYFAAGNLDLYAKTGPLTVSYYDGDELIASETYTKKITLREYQSDDTLFLGWYTDAALQNAYDASKASEYFAQGNICLYAKTELIMETFKINVTGFVEENKTVVNPIFTWAAGEETSFVASLYLKEKNSLVESREVAAPSFQSKRKLKANSEYVLRVEGGSGAQSFLRFQTTTTGGAYSGVMPISLSDDPFANDMVLQRGVENVFTGTAPACALISVSLTRGEETTNYSVISDQNGTFSFVLPPQEASFTPATIRFATGLMIDSKNTCEKSLTNVLFGDVYLFAGQSNMQWLTKDSDYEKSDIEALSESYVRFYCQDVNTSTSKLQNVKNGRWFLPGGNNCDWFSAVATMSGYFLGTDLKEETPIGIITAYQGDTNIGSWMGTEYYDGTCNKKHEHYNAMVYPLRNANLSGVVWYQGCNNSAAAYDYEGLLGDLFRNYRDLFRNEDMPFFVIGLACFDGDKDENGNLDPMHNPYNFAYVRESQAAACAADDNAYFISTCDDGDPTYIHPRAKRYICRRVANSIEVVLYGKEGYAEGPSYKSHEIDGGTVTIELNNADGLYATGAITGLYLAGADGKYHAATAELKDGKIVASSDKVAAPVYVKYGFLRSPFVNIYNKDGYVITPFRTDEYDTNIDLFDYEDADVYAFHPDGATMTVSFTEDGNLQITKATTNAKEEWRGFGSVILEKFGAIAYRPECLEVTLKGENTGAKIIVRFTEGSGEIWGCTILDDSAEKKTVTVDLADETEFKVLYGNQDNAFDAQKIRNAEIVVEYDGEVTVEVCNVRFVHKA